MNQKCSTFKLNRSLTSSYVFSNGTIAPITTENESLYALLAVPIVSISSLIGLFFYSYFRSECKKLKCKKWSSKVDPNEKSQPQQKRQPNEKENLIINFSFNIKFNKKD